MLPLSGTRALQLRNAREACGGKKKKALATNTGFWNDPKGYCAVFKGIYLEKRVHKLYLTQNGKKSTRNQRFSGKRGQKDSKQVFLCAFSKFMMGYRLITPFSRDYL